MKAAGTFTLWHHACVKEKKMDESRKKNVTGGGKGIKKRGEALDTNGPVGRADGYEGRKKGDDGRGVMDIINAVGSMTQSSGGAQQSGNKPGNAKPQGYKPQGYVSHHSSGGGGGSAPAVKLNGKTILVLIIGVILFVILLKVFMSSSGGGGEEGGSQGGGGGGSTSIASLLGFGGGSSAASSANWDETLRNTGKLNTEVAEGSRAKYVTPVGNGQDKITIMVYTCGTDLESKSGMASNDIAEMCRSELSDKINIIVYTGGCKKWKTEGISNAGNQIYKVEKGGIRQLVADDGEKPMTDPNTLIHFIDYCADNYPADRNMLIFWDHGGGSISGYGYDEKFASKGSMDLKNINYALKTADKKFDFIGFDACLMATLETALVCSNYADYLIASEETEPGIGWYYTDWLNELSKNTSQPTVEIGKNIIDSFVSECSKKCGGQKTTLSIIDLAEFSSTVPPVFMAFSNDTAELITGNDYQKVSDARTGSREFAVSSKIDQIDLVNFASKIGTNEAKNLVSTLLSAVKYNNTSDNMSNAYGVSIYFPYKKVNKVDSVVASYPEIGMVNAYGRCIKAFAGVETSGQIAAGGTSSPAAALSGGSSSSGVQGSDILSELLSAFLSGGRNVPGIDRSSAGYMEDIKTEEVAAFIAANQFDTSKLVWKTDDKGRHLLELADDQWKLIQSLQINMFYDDGEGYLDLGLDNLYTFEDGRLVGDTDNTWLSIDGQPVAYYYESTIKTDNGTVITGRVPALIDGTRCNIIITFDKEHENGYISGARYDYVDGETETVAKSLTEIENGAKIDFICDYYTYDEKYAGTYEIGETYVYEGNATISNTDVGGDTKITYLLTDIYNNEYWTPSYKGSSK